MPFREWDLPPSIQLVRDRILKPPKGDRAFVELLLMAREFGLEPLQVACELVLDLADSPHAAGDADRVGPAEAPDRTARRLQPLRPFARGEPCRSLI